MYQTNELLEQQKALPAKYAAVFKKVYLWMSFALVISGLTAMYIAKQPEVVATIFSNNLYFILMMVAQLGLVWFISARIMQITSFTATLLFIAYAILTGFTLSLIFLAFTAESITTVFYITAGTFAAVSLYGYTTKSNLSSFGGYLFMGLIGLIIASVVNWFLKSEMLYWIVSYVGVMIFVGLTAYDTQKIKTMVQAYGCEDTETTNKVALIGALELYLDFINLFLYLLRIFGKRR
ncbi:MAG: Bax inhibitor-1/YccA family protein [Bacteroides sp.]|nr:Bax inhibitor-1/YccA family protein [Bacteroides sp.]